MIQLLFIIDLAKAFNAAANEYNTYLENNHPGKVLIAPNPHKNALVEIVQNRMGPLTKWCLEVQFKIPKTYRRKLRALLPHMPMCWVTNARRQLAYD